MRIKQYPETMTLADTDDFLVETEGGTKRIAKSTLDEVLKPTIEPDEEEEIYDVVALHRNTYRGKNIGSAFTDEQKKAIKDGTFDDLYIGDYWKINNYTWRIADIDYYMAVSYDGGENKVTDHHLVIIPDETLFKCQWNTYNTLDGGYTNSHIYYGERSNALNIIYPAFGNESILPVPEVLISAQVNGRPSASVIKTSSVILPNQIMFLGSAVTEAQNGVSGLAAMSNTFESTQLALFRLNRRCLASNDTYWFKDFGNDGSTSIAMIFQGENMKVGRASVNNTIPGFRPVFCIHG